MYARTHIVSESCHVNLSRHTVEWVMSHTLKHNQHETSPHTHTHTHTRTHTHTHTHTRIHVRACTLTHTYMHTHIRSHPFTHTTQSTWNVSTVEFCCVETTRARVHTRQKYTEHHHATASGNIMTHSRMGHGTHIETQST